MVGGVSNLQEATGRLRKLVFTIRQMPILPVAIIMVLLILAIFADRLVPYDPTDAVLRDKLLPPFWQAGGNSTHLLGTDLLGRDLLSRIIMGARVSLSVSLAAIIFGGGIGTLLGLIAGYRGGWLDAVIMRTADGMLAFPVILLALLMAIILGPNLQNLIIIIGLVLWARFARLVRGDALSLKNKEFVASAKVAGASKKRIILRHIMPNILNTVIVMATLQVGQVILMEASLSFLGAGIPPPTPSWGGMVNDGRGYIETAWWLSVFPGVAILITVLALNLFGDWLRDHLDPKLRNV